MVRWKAAQEKGLDGEWHDTKYAIKSTCGRFHICKNYLDGCTLFVLYDGDKIMGYWEDACEAKSMAETLSNA